jgi:peptidylprolyl isomerase
MGNVARTRRRSGPVLFALLGTAAISLSACSSGSGSKASGSTTPTTQTSTSSSSSSGSTPSTSAPAAGDKPVVENTGIKVTGAFDAKPTVTFPATQPPKQLVEQTLVAGKGAPVTAGDTVIMNYLGDVWPTKAGAQAKVFDSSFSRGAPAGFVIGAGAVIPGFDKTLVGQHLGSRMLLSIPPADGYGTSGNAQAGITGTDTLVFVVDLLSDYKPNASAPGTAAGALPATGWPKITSTPGKEPQVTSVAGVKAPTSPMSELMVKGSGAAIDPSKTLVLQLVQTDVATGKQTQSSWGKDPQLVSAQSVLSVVTVLKGQDIGARAVALLPPTAAQPARATATSQPASPAQILVVDVVGQF